jgi:glycosyltransferase involved in cell wall biosynthesis
MQEKLSVILIVKNEADHIRRCLTSVAWADEIIVLDSGSTDGTAEIVLEFTPHLYRTDWPGYGPQKNRALEKAQYPWVLAIDADEELTPELQKEIKNILSRPEALDGYAIQRQSLFCGRWIRHGDWASDWVVRLWRRGRGQFENRLVHEKLLVEGKVGRLSHIMRHYTYPHLGVALTKMNHYSTIWARESFLKGKKGGIIQGWSRALWSFLRGYVVRAGFLDGWQGFVLAVTNSIGTFYKYIKLKEYAYLACHQENSHKDTAP